MVITWESDHSKSNLYVLVKYGKYQPLQNISYTDLITIGLTEADVKLLLVKQEEDLVSQGVPPLHKKWNASTFIIAGLGLEESSVSNYLIYD